MKRWISASIAAALAVAINISAWGFQFSADVVTYSREGRLSGKIFVDNDKVRMEMADAITITRGDRGVSWLIVPSQNMFIEQPMDARNVMASSEKAPGETDRINAGDDMVNGRPAVKYRVYYNSGGVQEQVDQWIDMEYKMPVKTAAVDGSWSVEFMNISMGNQSALLFEIPEKYNKMQIPNIDDMMKAARAGAPAQEGLGDD